MLHTCVRSTGEVPAVGLWSFCPSLPRVALVLNSKKVLSTCKYFTHPILPGCFSLKKKITQLRFGERRSNFTLKVGACFLARFFLSFFPCMFLCTVERFQPPPFKHLPPPHPLPSPLVAGECTQAPRETKSGMLRCISSPTLNLVRSLGRSVFSLVCHPLLSRGLSGLTMAVLSPAFHQEEPLFDSETPRLNSHSPPTSWAPFLTLLSRSLWDSFLTSHGTQSY